MNFHNEIKQNIPAVQILNNALDLMEQEMEYFSEIGEEKWRTLTEYGVANGEFKDVYVTEIVSIILYAYQGVRMFSCVITMSPKIITSIINILKNK